jgi:hypothetical protein
VVQISSLLTSRLRFLAALVSYLASIHGICSSSIVRGYGSVPLWAGSGAPYSFRPGENEDQGAEIDSCIIVIHMMLIYR